MYYKIREESSQGRKNVIDRGRAGGGREGVGGAGGGGGDRWDGGVVPNDNFRGFPTSGTTDRTKPFSLHCLP